MGVSLTGIMDNPLTNGSKGKLDELLEELRDVRHETNCEWRQTWSTKSQKLPVLNLQVQLGSCR